MRLVLYGLAWTCILLASMCAGFAPVGPWYGRLAAILLVSGVLFGIAANILVRKTTRKCRHCGERTHRSLTFCQLCGTTFSGWAPLPRQ
jgi:hypothetical protein